MAFAGGVIGMPLTGETGYTGTRLVMSQAAVLDPATPSEFYSPNDPIRIVVQDPDEAGQEIAPGTEFGNQAGRTLGKGALAGRFVGAVVGTMSDWFIDQIWISPSPIEFGSIISSRQVTVDLLSTFRYQNRQFTSVDLTALGAGVSLLNDPTPVELKPQSEFSVTLEATPDGPPSFDANVIFAFDHRSVSIRSTGRRLILFWYQPEQPFEEELGWFTDIEETRSGNEFRDSLRVTPRQQFKYRVASENDKEASSLRNLLLAFRSFIFGIPVWHEQKKVGAAVTAGGTVISVDTTNIDHRANGTMMVWEPVTRTFQDASILSFNDTSITLTAGIGADISEDAIIIPIRFGYLISEPQYNDAPVNHVETLVTFETTDNVELGFADQTAVEAEFTVHPEDSIVVLSDPNLMQNNAQNRSEVSSFGKIDNQIGTFQLSSKAPRSFLQGSKGTTFHDLAELRRWRSFLHWLRGSWGEFYLPTFRNDLPIALEFTLSAGTITIDNVGIAAVLGAVNPRRAIMLELADGSQFFSSISTATEIDTATESISLTTPFGATSDVVPTSARISFLELTRIEGDSANILHTFAGDGTIRFATKTIQR